MLQRETVLSVKQSTTDISNKGISRYSLISRNIVRKRVLFSFIFIKPLYLKQLVASQSILSETRRCTLSYQYFAMNFALEISRVEYIIQFALNLL